MQTTNKYFWGFSDDSLHFWHWYSVLADKLTARIKIHNVPDSIDHDYLVRRLLLDGKIAFFNDEKDGLTAYEYTNTSPFDKYGRTKEILVTYKYGNATTEQRFTSGDNCVLVFAKPSVKLHRGVGFVSEVCRSADILATIDTTLNIRLENDRVIAIVDAISDSDVEAVDILFQKIRKGDRAIAVKSSMIDKISVNPLNNSTTTDYPEYTQLTQYYLAEFYNSIGVSALSTSKRERMVTDEVTANKEVVDFNFKRNIETIQEGLDEVNAKFNTNMYVEFIELHDDDEVIENESGTAESSSSLHSEEDSETKAESVEEVDTVGERNDMDTPDNSINTDNEQADEQPDTGTAESSSPLHSEEDSEEQADTEEQTESSNEQTEDIIEELGKAEILITPIVPAEQSEKLDIIQETVEEIQETVEEIVEGGEANDD